MQIGFAGLGRMGIAMARNLVHAGHDVTALEPVLRQGNALCG